jgi:hypothetical protein
MLIEVTNGVVLVVQQATRVQRAEVPATVIDHDEGLLSAARNVPEAAGVVQEKDGRVIITTPAGEKLVVSRNPSDGQVILTPVPTVATTAHTAISPADFMPPKYVVEGAVTVVAMLCGTIFLAPVLRYMLRRRERKLQVAPAAADPQVVQRLDRIEQAIEAIAIEVERSAEAQRYSARLLTERMPEPAVPVSATTESLAVPRRGAHVRE